MRHQMVQDGKRFMGQVIHLLPMPQLLIDHVNPKGANNQGLVRRHDHLPACLVLSLHIFEKS